MKGVSPILSYAILFVIGLTVISLMLLLTSNTVYDLEKRFVLSQMDHIVEVIRKSVMELYYSGVDYGRVELPIPEKIGDRKYTISFMDGSVKIKVTLRDEVLEKERNIPININLTGASYPPAFILIERNHNVLKLI
jgi:hypothetical protein